MDNDLILINNLILIFLLFGFVVVPMWIYLWSVLNENEI